MSLAKPDPAGINLPTTTFSLRPLKWSTLPVVAASVRTLVVSWKEAAEMKDSVASEAFVIPNKILSYSISAFLASLKAKLAL